MTLLDEARRIAADRPHGSAAAVAGSDAERLTREALFLLVFGSRPQIRTALLDRLGRLGLKPG